MKLKNIKFDKIFIYVSIVFLLSLFILYVSRFTYFFVKEKSKKNVKNISFSEELIKSDELVLINDSYYFQGENPNNYVMYSGMLFRIVSITDSNIKLVLNDSITPLVMSYDDSDYKDTYVNEWLNKIDDKEYTGIFEKYLVDLEKYLVKTNTCIDITDDINKDSCDSYNNDYYVGLLSIDDYFNAQASSSYLNNGESFWLSNKSLNGNYWSVSINGKLSDNTKSKVSYKSYGVRPTITLKCEVPLLSGDGTLDNPYKIEDSNNTILRNEYIGSFINYAGYKWQIIANDKEKTKLVLVDGLKENDEYILNTYSNLDTSFLNSNLYEYLNTIFIDSFTNREYLLEGVFYNGSYNEESMYDYKNIYTSSINSYVGLLSVSDMYLYDVNDIFMLTPYNDKMIYTIQNYSLFKDVTSNKLRIRPVIYIKSLLKVSGNGTLDNPFEIEGEV